jgi:hypothetical protein
MFAIVQEKGPAPEIGRRAFACLIVVDKFDVPNRCAVTTVAVSTRQAWGGQFDPFMREQFDPFMREKNAGSAGENETTWYWLFCSGCGL